jgi:integrase
MKTGYWATHRYSRRSVERDVEEFVGWPKLEKLISKVPEYNRERNQALFAATFLTGGRIEEVLQLVKSNFTVDLEAGEIIIRGMKLLKRYEKTGSWIEWIDQKPKNKLARLYSFDEGKKQFHRNRFTTEKKDETRREFRFATTENFASILIEWLRKTQELLFNGYFTSKPLSYPMAYRIITATGMYPHWLRAQRASCLISEYGWKMEMMMEWMGWEELTTARHYAKYGPSSLVAGKKS